MRYVVSAASTTRWPWHGRHGHNIASTNAISTEFLSERLRYFSDDPLYLPAKATKDEVDTGVRFAILKCE